MKTYFCFTKKGLLVILAAVICIGFIFCEIAAVNNSTANALTNADRLIFIKNLGYTVIDKAPATKTVNIPEVFYDVYENYNALQQKANYDLLLYKGCEVIIYTYKINPLDNHTGECVANLIVYKNRVIGGDISSSALGGFMLPLQRVIN